MQRPGSASSYRPDTAGPGPGVRAGWTSAQMSVHTQLAWPWLWWTNSHRAVQGTLGHFLYMCFMSCDLSPEPSTQVIQGSDGFSSGSAKVHGCTPWDT